MKRLSTVVFLLSAVFVLSAQSIFAQLSGTKNIPSDYPTIPDLNTKDVGAVNANVVANDHATALEKDSPMKLEQASATVPVESQDAMIMAKGGQTTTPMTKAKGEQTETPVTKGEQHSPEQPDADRPNSVEVASNYVFSTATNASLTDMSTGTTQLVAANSDDVASAVNNIGFDFYFQGARFSQFSANSNGLIRLGGTAVQGAAPFKPLAQAGLSLITPYGADLRTHTTGKVHFKVIGSAPSRMLVVEWLNMQSNFNSGGTVDLNFQARLSETTGVIAFVYGSMTMSTLGAADANSRDPNIGFSSSNTAGTVGSIAAPQSGVPAPSYDGSSATATANLYTAGAITVLTSASQGSRRIFTLTPPTPTAPTTLSFTTITATGMTLNWGDSPDETLYGIYRSTDGVNYVFDGTAAQNATSYAATLLVPGTTYFWQVFAVSEGALSTALSGSQATVPPGNITSAASGNWDAPATWGGSVPTAIDNVTIANGHTVTINSSNALNLTVQSGGILQFEATTARTLNVGQAVTIDAGGTFQSNSTGTQTGHVLSVGTNLTNNGTLDFSTNANTAGAGITFIGGANNTFSGTGATTDIRGITLNKGTSNANILEITTSNLTVRGVNTDAAGFLTLTNGTLKISSTFTMTNRVFTSATYVIPATGGIWLNNPNFTVVGQAGGTTTSNNGLFRVSQGIYNIGVGVADGMGGGAGAVFNIDGGTVNASGRIDPQSAVSYTQSAGTVNVGIVGNTRSNFGSFELFSSSSSFTMSGGAINLVNATVAATPVDYRVLSGTVNFSGGTLNVGTAATATNFNFRISGSPPNLIIDNTTNNKTATFIAQTLIRGTVLVNTGTTYSLNGFLVSTSGATFTNNGTVTGTTAGSRMYWGGTVAQTYTGTGTVTPVLVSFDVDNPLGVTIDPAVTNIVTRRIILFSGGVTNTNKLTLGNADATVSVIQIGNTTTPTAAGTFDVPPIFNLGTGGQTISYLRTTTARTTGPEVNPTRTFVAMTYDDDDATHALTIVGGDLTVGTTLTLTNGNINTAANTLTVGTSVTTLGSVVRTNGRVVGNLKRWIAVTSTTVLFPIGTATNYRPANITYTAAPSAGGTLLGFFTASNPGTNGLPLNDGGTSIINAGGDGFWTLTAGDGLTGGTYTLNLTADAFGNVSDFTTLRILKRVDAVSAWTLDGTHVTGTGTNATPVVNRSGMSGFSQFGIGGASDNPLPIQLAYLNAILNNNGLVNVRWGTVSEINNYGFEVQKSQSITENFATIPNSFVAGHGTTNEPQQYAFVDNTTQSGSWYYRLKQIDLDGTVNYTEPVHVDVLTGVPEPAPREFALKQNYPNPFNPETIVKFSVENTARATLEVYNVLGQKVATLFDGIAEAGQYYKIRLNGTSLASGMYIYRLQSGTRTDVKKMILMK